MNVCYVKVKFTLWSIHSKYLFDVWKYTEKFWDLVCVLASVLRLDTESLGFNAKVRRADGVNLKFVYAHYVMKAHPFT